MDPTVALERVRTLIACLASGDDVADELIETYEGLDGWLSSGGFLPAAWEKNRTAPTLYGIHATWERKNPGGWVASGQVPTFFLDAAVQGIQDEALAKRVALEILGSDEGLSYHVTAVRV